MRRDGTIDRRAWLATLAVGWATSALADDGPKLDEADERELKAIRDVADKFGVKNLRSPEPTEHYLSIGDANPAFQAEALGLCEGLAGDYLAHFRAKGFAIEPPAHRLTVIALASARSFSAFTGEPEESVVGGVYEPQTNRLVIFDNRSNGGRSARRANSVSLFHEAMHQLTFNTGLLDRAGDVPLCVSEGLGMYGEVRRPKGLGKVGDKNVERLRVLTPRPGERMPWIAVRDLFRDGTFDDPDPARLQVPYAMSWLLVDFLMKTEARTGPFREYLEAIRGRRDPDSRLRDAEAALGDLGALDADLRKFAARLVKR